MISFRRDRKVDTCSTSLSAYAAARAKRSCELCLFTFFSWRNTRAWAGEGTGTPLFGLYRYVQPQKVGFLSCFGLKKVIDLDHSEIGYFFSLFGHWVFSVLQSFSRGSVETSRNFRRFLYILSDVIGKSIPY